MTTQETALADSILKAASTETDNEARRERLHEYNTLLQSACLRREAEAPIFKPATAASAETGASAETEALEDWIRQAALMLEAAGVFIINDQHEQGKPCVPDCIEGFRGLLELCPIDVKSSH